MLLHIKQLKISSYGIWACIIIVLATLLRIVLIAQGWPHSNADEDTMGIMAMHIAYHGEHPIFFYGQHYMGTLEAYLAAAFFHLLGASVFSLRLGSVLFLCPLLSQYISPGKFAIYKKTGINHISVTDSGIQYHD